MGCKLIAPPGSPTPTPGPPPSGPDTFSAPAGSQVVIFTDTFPGPGSGTAHIVEAHLNGAKLTPDANFKISFQVSAGVNILRMAFDCSNPDEIFRINEDCQDGTSKILRTWKFSLPAPGGPTTEITINGT